MEIVKKNIISIICGVVALAAVVVAFFIVPGKASELQTQLDARKAANDEMTQLLRKDRTLPAPDASDPNPKPLTRFPSEPIIKQGEAIIAQLEKESVALRDAAVAMNRHDLLVQGSLPRPTQVQAYEFRNAYQRALPLPLPNQANQPQQQPSVLNSAFARYLQAGMPPSPNDIALKVQQRAEEIKQKEAFLLPNGQIGNQEALNLKISEMQQKLPGELRSQVANSSKVYISPDTFEIYPRIASVSGAPDPIDIYFAQLSYWIQEDVVKAVKEVNESAKNVTEAPVKHLVSIRVKSQGIPTFITPIDGTNVTDPDTQLPKVPQVSPTGRVCNGLYDVFHFQVKADVQADKVAEFLRGLGRNRFITPMSVDVQAGDIATSLAQGLQYGDKPVVNLTAECEVLYMRKWNAPLMPQAIRTRLAIPDEQPQPGGDLPPAVPAAAQQSPESQPPPSLLDAAVPQGGAQQQEQAAPPPSDQPPAAPTPKDIDAVAPEQQPSK